jgi:hypothetical protein
LKAAGELAPAGIHQDGIDLVVDEAVHFQDAIA